MIISFTRIGGREVELLYPEVAVKGNYQIKVKLSYFLLKLRLKLYNFPFFPNTYIIKNVSSILQR